MDERWADQFATRELADIRATRCRTCKAKPGEQCTEADGTPRKPHRQRIYDAIPWQVS